MNNKLESTANPPRPRRGWRRIKKVAWTVALLVLVVLGYRFLQRQVAIAELSRLGARFVYGVDLPSGVRNSPLGLLIMVTGVGKHVTSVNLAASRATDRDLEYLQYFPHLQRLNLSDTRVTDAGLVHLKGLKELHTLSFRGTRVTSAGLRDLGKALPNIPD